MKLRWRRIAIVLAGVLGAYLVVRAGVELVNIDYGDPSAYAKDWGGPSLAGVLAVHCGPGLAVLAGFTWWTIRWARRIDSAGAR